MKKKKESKKGNDKINEKDDYMEHYKDTRIVTNYYYRPHDK